MCGRIYRNGVDSEDLSLLPLLVFPLLNFPELAMIDVRDRQNSDYDWWRKTPSWKKD